MTKRQWRFGGDTQLDRARTMARVLYKALEAVDPRGAATLAEAFAHDGERWLTHRRDTSSPTGWLTREEVADLGGVDPPAVTMWGSRGIKRGGRVVKLTRHPEGYDEAEARDFIALAATPEPKGTR